MSIDWALLRSIRRAPQARQLLNLGRGVAQGRAQRSRAARMAVQIIMIAHEVLTKLSVNGKDCEDTPTGGSVVFEIRLVARMDPAINPKLTLPQRVERPLEGLDPSMRLRPKDAIQHDFLVRLSCRIIRRPKHLAQHELNEEDVERLVGQPKADRVVQYVENRVFVCHSEALEKSTPVQMKFNNKIFLARLSVGLDWARVNAIGLSEADFVGSDDGLCLAPRQRFCDVGCVPL